MKTGGLAAATVALVAATLVTLVVAGCVVGAGRGSIPGDPGTDAQAIGDAHAHFDHRCSGCGT